MSLAPAGMPNGGSDVSTCSAYRGLLVRTEYAVNPITVASTVTTPISSRNVTRQVAPLDSVERDRSIRHLAFSTLANELNAHAAVSAPNNTITTGDPSDGRSP